MRFPTLTNWLKKTPSTAKKARLGLEALEVREVPATHTWTDAAGNGLWTDTNNWTGGVPTTGEAGGTIVNIPLNDTTMFQNIPGLVVNQLNFTNNGSATLVLFEPLGISGTSGAGGLYNVTNAAGTTNTITGLTGDELQLTSGVDPFFRVNGKLTIDTVISGNRNFVVTGGNGELVLTKDNTYAGNTQVNQGVLTLDSPVGGGHAIPTGTQLLVGNGNTSALEAVVRLMASSQLSSTTPITVDTDGGFLQINGADTVIGDLTLKGGSVSAGNGNLAIKNIDAQADVTITAAAGGFINLLNGQHTIDVDAGKTLTITAPIRNAGGGAVGGIIKTGAGELFFNNQQVGNPNAYTGLTHVKDGTLRLQNVAANSAFQGDLTIGDGNGAAGSAAVILNVNSEIPDGLTPIIWADGKLDLGSNSETVGGIIFFGGGLVVATTGTLTLSGNAAVLLDNFNGAPAATATISANVTLGAGGSFSVQNAPDELVIDGVITGTNLLDIGGDGTVQFAGSSPNNYPGITFVNGATLVLGQSAGTNGAVPNGLFIQDGGTVRLLNNEQISNNGQIKVDDGGTLDLNGHAESIGALSMGKNSTITTGQAGTLHLNDNVSIQGGGSTISGNLTLGGATRTFDGPGNLHITAVVINGGITKTGTGLLILSGLNTYSGPTTLNAGELWIHLNQPQSDVTVTGGVLNMNNAIGKLTMTGGTVSPGKEESSQPKTKDFTLGAGTYVADLYGPNVNDQINVTGTANLTGGTLDLNRVFGPNIGTPPATGQVFTILSNDGADAVVGTFNGLGEGATIAADGRTFQITYVGGDGNDVVVTDVTPISPPPPPATSPEPFAVGGGAGAGSTVKVFNADGTPKSDLQAFEASFSGGVRTATGDVNGDGTPDVIVGTGPGRVAEVRVFDGITGQQILANTPFADFTGGTFVATGDFNADGFDDIVITPDEGGGPRVTIVSGKDGAILSNFFAIDDPAFRGGARAAVGDVNGDGTPDLVVSAGFGGGPRIAVYDGSTLGGTPTKLVNDFFAFEPALRNGAYVAVGDLNADGKEDLIFGGGPGGGPRVLALDSAAMLGGNQTVLANFFAGNVENRGGVRVAAKNLDNDAKADIVVGDGAGTGSRVTAYLGKDLSTASAAFDAFPGFLGGVFVG